MSPSLAFTEGYYSFEAQDRGSSRSKHGSEWSQSCGCCWEQKPKARAGWRHGTARQCSGGDSVIPPLAVVVVVPPQTPPTAAARALLQRHYGAALNLHSLPPFLN